MVWNLTRRAKVRVAEREDVRAERWRLDDTKKAVFGGESASDSCLVGAASLSRTFPTVPADRIRTAVDVLTGAMSPPGKKTQPDSLDRAAIEIADIFTAE